MSGDSAAGKGLKEGKEARNIYVDFDAFLKRALHDYYLQSGKKQKASFIALLIVSGEMPSLALDSLTSFSGIKKIALGAAGVLALRLGLRYALSGPLGILMVGVTAASLVAYFIRHRGEIMAKIGRQRQLVGNLRKSFDQLQADVREGRLNEEQRDLMADGLMKRFLMDLDA